MILYLLEMPSETADIYGYFLVEYLNLTFSSIYSHCVGYLVILYSIMKGNKVKQSSVRNFVVKNTFNHFP